MATKTSRAPPATTNCQPEDGADDKQMVSELGEVLQKLSYGPNKTSLALGLLLRCTFSVELDQQEAVISDLRRALKLLTDMKDVHTTLCYVRRWLILALYRKQKLSQAEDMVREWLNQLYEMSEETKQPIAILERYLAIFQLSTGDRERGKRPQLAILDSEMQQLDEKLNNWIRDSMPGDQLTENNLHPFRTMVNNRAKVKLLLEESLAKAASATSDGIKSNPSDGSSEGEKETGHDDEQNNSKGKRRGKTNNKDQEGFSCTYCATSYASRGELTAHCQSESHQIVIMSDEGRDWKWRPPPRGFEADTYALCESFTETGVCHYSGQCIEAHGAEELNEWKQRFEYRRMRLERAREKELYGKSYTETLLEKWVSASAPDQVMAEVIDAIAEDQSPPLSIVISTKESQQNFPFSFKTTKELRAVALLQDAYRNHFKIGEIRLKGSTTAVSLPNDQEWVNPEPMAKDRAETVTHHVEVSFCTSIYGTFRQSVVFDFGTEPALVKHICVDVVPVSDMDKLAEIKKDLVVYTAKRWDDSTADIIPYKSGFVVPETAEQKADAEYERQLMERYPCPSAVNLQLSQSTIAEKRLTKNNYRSRMHELLFVEEIARYENVARFNLTTKLKVTANYLLTPCGMASTSAKYSNDGELFALLQLRRDLSEDTSAGRLILNNCTAVNLALAEEDQPQECNGKRRVYESVIEDKGKNSIYLKLSPRVVKDWNLKSDKEITVDIQFKLNRLSFCEWHRAVDKVADYRLIFPDTLTPPVIPWTPKKQWLDVLDGAKMNAKQKEAVLAITSPQTVPLPPILLIGPFGTGKTFTLALAIKQLLTQPEPRILICTHSNSAADLYIKDYLHPWVKDEGLEAARPLRVYYHKRWVTTAHPTVQEYCLIDTTPNLRTFRRPTVEDLTKHRIIVVTLSISMELASLNLPKGFFTHIFLDEAAQAMECEAIMALALASETTKIVLAGDHMQMSPELFSGFAKERNMHMSLLERLYDHYPTDFPCKILLCENYRAHEAIIKYTSELFYDQKLVASGKQPRHDKFYPLTFFTTRGEDVQDRNSTTFFNNAEVYELVERVAELAKNWPSAWGAMTEGSIGIMTPYADQVMRIRMELRKRKLGKISVERVLNVQGKQFRAVFLSTVRTRKTCPNQSGSQREVDYGFLSNSKLLNTAITRAQSLVAVVGDPVALCSVGRCRKVWERFIETCNENKSLFGITWSMLRAQLDGVELKKTYVLNPMAPEFVPRAELIRRMMITGGGGNDMGTYYSGPDHLHPAPPTAAQSSQQAPQAPYYPQMNPQNCPANMRHGQQPRPYLNIDDMLEMYHPGGPSNMQRRQQQPPSNYHHQPHNSHPHNHHQQQQQPQTHPNQHPIFGMAKNPMVRQHSPNPQLPMNGPPFYAPRHPNQMPPPPHGPTAGHSSQPVMGNQLPPPAAGAVKWGTVPPNINPQLTGTNAWQMAKPQIPASMPPQPPQPPPPPMNMPMGGQFGPQINPHNRMMSPTHRPQQQQQMGSNLPSGYNQSAMGNNFDFGMGPNPNFPLGGVRNSNPNNNVNQMRIPPGFPSGGGSPYPQQLPPNVPMARNPSDDLLRQMHLQHQQQLAMRMGGPPLEADLASFAALQERFMMMNAGPRMNVANPQLPIKNGLSQNPVGVLLPPNRNIYEMALESKDVQLKWFTRLVETHGWDAAYKFAEMMGQAQSVMAQELNKGQQVANNSYPVQQQQQQPLHQPQSQPHLMPYRRIPSPNVRSINNQVDIAFDSLMNGSTVQPMRRLFDEASPSKSGPIIDRVVDDCGIFGPTMGLPVPEVRADNGNASSVPLYRRQAGQSTNSSSSVSSMSSQSANGWLGAHDVGPDGNKLSDNLFHRMAGDFGDLFGEQLLAGDRRGGGNGDGSGNAGGNMTYASVLSQANSNKVGNNLLVGMMGGDQRTAGHEEGKSAPGGHPQQQQQQQQQLGEHGNRNGFYNYFG